MLSPKWVALRAELQSLASLSEDDGFGIRLDHALKAVKEEIKSAYPLEVISPLLEVFRVGYEDWNWSIVTLVEKYPNLQEVYPLIQQATRSTNAGTRAWCCFLLGRRRNKEDEPFFVACLHDEDAVVRRYALTGIIMVSQHHPKGHLIPLVQPLLQDENYTVTRTARDAMEALSETT